MYSAIKCMSPLSLCFYLLFSLNSNAREQQPNLIKYTFAIDHKSINQKISIEQPLIIPQYEISLRSTITSKTCTKIVCTDDNKNKKLNPKQTWNGVFDWKQKINLDISEEEFSFRLSNIITGLDPILSSKIVSMGIAKKVFKKRPENWEQFTKMMAKLNKLINHAGIIYDLYTDIVLVHGYENARDLGYYDEKLCVKNSYSCNADQLEVRKKLITETSKNIIINYTPSKNSGKVKLYPNEVDYFDFYIGQNDKDFFIDPRDKHNSYLVNYEKNTSNGDVTINITPIARRKVPLPDNFLYTFSDSYISCIFFDGDSVKEISMNWSYLN